MSLYLDWNLGLGDAIICNGLVRELAKREQVILPCWERNLASVRHMFSDLPNVAVKEHVHGKMEHAHSSMILSIGLNHPQWGTVEPFDRAFYVFAGVPFDCRWSSFKMPAADLEPCPISPTHAYAAICRQTSIGIFELRDEWIAMRHGYEPRASPDTVIGSWVPFLSMADEIHCVDSAMLHLAESIPTRGRLFFHKYARGGSPGPGNVTATLRKDWKVIE